MQKTSKIWTWLAILTLALLCAGAGARLLHRAGVEAVWPVENGIRWFVRGVSARIPALIDAQGTVRRMRRLEDEVEQLRLDARMLEEVAQENRELRQALGLPPGVLRRPLRCEVVSRGGALGWWQTIKISRGSRDGVLEGDAVVSADGLVGRVRKVYSDISDVMLVTDPNSRIACRIDLPEGGPPLRGVLHGNGRHLPAGVSGEAAGDSELPGFLFVAEPMSLEYLDRARLADGSLPARTRVVTSGLSGTIPGGITAGWLVSAALDDDGLYGVGRVLPAADPSEAKALFVLVGRRDDP